MVQIPSFTHTNGEELKVFAVSFLETLLLNLYAKVASGIFFGLYNSYFSKGMVSPIPPKGLMDKELDCIVHCSVVYYIVECHLYFFLSSKFLHYTM